MRKCSFTGSRRRKTHLLAAVLLCAGTYLFYWGCTALVAGAAGRGRLRPSKVVLHAARKKTRSKLRNSKLSALKEKIQDHWQFTGLRENQEDVMENALAGRDVLAVMGTGTGKSLCFQAPALLQSGVTLVVCPLISLMKDQVDNLQKRGIAAAQLSSTMTNAKIKMVFDSLQRGDLKLLYVAPERLESSEKFCEGLPGVDVSALVVDEAHCISSWGHDFRPEYRRLSDFRKQLEKTSGKAVPVQAFTATATSKVRDDIIKQLKLKDPSIIVGSFDRPNLNYSSLWRADKSGLQQTLEIIDRYPKKAGIIYCATRHMVETLCSELQEELEKRGQKCLPYHAGLPKQNRSKASEAYSKRQVDIIVATVAFGMGIDRPDTRFVVHTCLPNSLDSYAQESGRAGRDGKMSECVLLWQSSDYLTRANVLRTPGRRLDEIPARKLEPVTTMSAFAASPRCKHSILVRHFGGNFTEGCEDACDACIRRHSKVDIIPDRREVCCWLLKAVKTNGECTPKELAERLSADSRDKLGFAQSFSEDEIQFLLYQLISENYMEESPSIYRKRSLTEHGERVILDEAADIGEFGMLPPFPAKTKRSRKKQAEPARQSSSRVLLSKLMVIRDRLAGKESLMPDDVIGDAVLKVMAATCPEDEKSLLDIDGMGFAQLRHAEPFLRAIREYKQSQSKGRDDASLLASLKALRRKLASEKRLKTYLVFKDSALQEMVAERPKDDESFLRINGVGPAKLAQYGPSFLQKIRDHDLFE